MLPRVDAVAVPGWVDPERLFAHLFSAEASAYWLDAGVGATHGWSWMGVGVPEMIPEETPVGTARAEWDGAGAFRGGWVGWRGYEAGARRAGAPVAEGPDDEPEEVWLRAREIVAFDHDHRRIWTIAPPSRSTPWNERVREAVRAAAVLSAPEAPAPTIAVARHDPAGYAELIERCRESIRRGDAYQLCLTTRFTAEGAVDPFSAYRRLRATSRTGRGAYLRSGGRAVLSASPEQFLEVSSGRVRTRPIKGTRPRGQDADADAVLAQQLRASAKEQAENVMIVDLMRNDLARVCEPGSVRVDALLAVESYPHVHQLVSTVSGTLRATARLGELWEKTFPAGSMTGAPKLSAMTILHELEGAPRGVFAGCVGWVGDNGDLDLAMVIRTIVVGPDRAWVGAGGGITWSSVAVEEVAEVGIKARAPLAAVGAALPAGW